jgi:hypothetical protein
MLLSLLVCVIVVDRISILAEIVAVRRGKATRDVE